MKITREWVHEFGTVNGIGASWSQKQLAILGVPWPPKKGWLSRLIGTDELAERRGWTHTL